MAFGRAKKKISDETVLYECAVAALGRRMRSVAELKRLLRQRVPEGSVGEALIQAVITRLKEQRYLNDAEYASAYSSYRRDNEKFGRLRVVSELKSRGVQGEVIEKAVSGAYAEVNEEELARDFLRRKRLQKPANEKQVRHVDAGDEEQQCSSSAESQDCRAHIADDVVRERADDAPDLPGRGLRRCEEARQLQARITD